MKKIKFGKVEIFGYLGLLIWVVVIFIRGYDFSDNDLFLFLRGILPNLGAAWAATMFGKWIITTMGQKKVTIKSYLLLCVGIFLLALGSEVVHDIFFNSPFDIYDIFITILAQTCIFIVLVFTKDDCFK